MKIIHFFLKNIETNKIIEKNTSLNISNIQFNNNNDLIYIRKNKFINSQIYKHKINDSFRNDILIYNENSSNIFISISKSNDDKYFFIYRSTHKENQVLVFKQDKNDVFSLTDFEINTKSIVNHHDNKFYILKYHNQLSAIYSAKYRFVNSKKYKKVIFDTFNLITKQSKQRFIDNIFCFKKILCLY